MTMLLTNWQSIRTAEISSGSWRINFSEEEKIVVYVNAVGLSVNLISSFSSCLQSVHSRRAIIQFWIESIAQFV